MNHAVNDGCHVVLLETIELKKLMALQKVNYRQCLF